jgi:hypothetical protein
LLHLQAERETSNVTAAKGLHVMCDCPSKHVLVVRDDGEYSSTSDFDEDTLALLADDHEGNDDHPEENIDTGNVDHYESLVVQRVLHKWRE